MRVLTNVLSQVSGFLYEVSTIAIPDTLILFVASIKQACIIASNVGKELLSHSPALLSWVYSILFILCTLSHIGRWCEIQTPVLRPLLRNTRWKNFTYTTYLPIRTIYYLNHGSQVESQVTRGVKRRGDKK